MATPRAATSPARRRRSAPGAEVSAVSSKTRPQPVVVPSVRACTLAQRLRSTTNKTIGGLLMSNFFVFWAVPVVVQGQVFHLGLKHALIPIYRAIDNSTLRALAARYVYAKPQYADFAATSLLVLVSVSLAFGTVLYYQLRFGTLPLWLCVLYNFAWVGFGGRTMGSAYTFAHKEGHNALLYQRWLRRSVGNIFETWVGCLFGNVPYNFTTSHVHIHHHLDGGKGDSFYMWDVDRTSFGDFLLFVHRILLHMSGTSSLRYFRVRGMTDKHALLLRGCIGYWLVAPSVLFAVTRSPWFLFIVWLQPLIGMTAFLSIINWAFHGFIEFDADGKSIECVNAVTIINGQDDSFGEDDHMAHHYSTQTWYSETYKYRAKIDADLKRYHGSVFEKVSIFELSIMLLFSQFDELANKFVDMSGELSHQQIVQLLRDRGKRKELTYEEYADWCHAAEVAAAAALA